MRQISFVIFERFDWTLLTSALTLAAIGLVALYGIGTSRDPIDLFLFYKQFASTLLGLVAVFACAFFDYRQLRSYSMLLYLFGAGLLIFVLIVGHAVHSTQGWFRFGSLSFQPVEFAKLTLTIYLAVFFSRTSHRNLTWSAFMISGAATLFYVALVLLQPDFGSAMLLLIIWIALVLFVGLPRRALIILPIVALAAGALVWMIGLKTYQQNRLLGFLQPSSDVRGTNYNAIQARIAIGSGGLFGKGIGESSQARLRFLPEAATDFMFAVIGEEMGLIGIIVILGLFFVILQRGLKIGFDSDDDFAALMLIGFNCIFFTHLFINAGMNMGIMPITGIPLPFISSASSYLLIAFLSIGLMESVAIRRRTGGLM